jgi:hypothetical protein
MCIVYDKDATLCSGGSFASAYADTGTNIIKLGKGFTGMIRMFDIFDYPKIFQSTALQVKASASCNKFNGNSCLVCD